VFGPGASLAEIARTIRDAVIEARRG